MHKKHLCFTKHLSYSIKLDEVLHQLGVTKPSRLLKQDLGGALEEILPKHDYSLTKALYIDWKKSSTGLQLISGIRFPHQLQEWKYLVTDMCSVYIDATEKTRWQHNNLRRLDKGLSSISIEEFRSEHRADTEQHIQEMKQYATFVIPNNGTWGEFYESLTHLIDSLK